MLDSIKATLTRVLGPESAQVVEFYVDKHLAIEDPTAFEQALSDFLGSQAGGLLIDAIKSDLRNENAEARMPEPVSRFLSARAKSPPTQGTRDRLPENPISRQAPKTGTPQESFVRAAKLAMGKRVAFRDLVTDGLLASHGETSGYALLACLGRKALDDPDAFVERVATIFSLDGITILESLAAFFEMRADVRRVTEL